MGIDRYLGKVDNWIYYWHDTLSLKSGYGPRRNGTPLVRVSLHVGISSSVIRLYGIYNTFILESDYRHRPNESLVRVSLHRLHGLHGTFIFITDPGETNPW